MDSKYFIDCGGFVGDSAKLFRERYDTKCDYTIHTFEPNKALQITPLPKQIVHRKAVWVSKGMIPLYISRDCGGDRSTIYSDNTKGILDRENPLFVPCIDFSKWLLDNVEFKDRVIVKMNIEGAEYPVLEHLIAEETIYYIDHLLVQWHGHHIPSINNRLMQVKDEVAKYTKVTDLDGGYKSFGELEV